ncbi:type VI secretion system accessory protein TagJ [Chromatium okenii]|jgi:type VI secretion system protein ImpE|uniref:Virulence protein SciE type n=1 Tax=Chromatium okenii TaxID=61644 RepID=A0A2S7XNZ8_9GAMM|nr:type VI secretion system accessory protein TagJ [Chromatium okenii]PQJ95152.1 virulence protein SciE type [Chromatium okenii]
MQAEQSLKDGDLDETLRQLQAQVRKDPANANYRVFLFQLLAVLGQWERALNQLGVAGELDAATLPMVQTYREALRCEVLRAAIFAGRRAPLIFGEPEEWLALLLEAQRFIAQGANEQAIAVREQAFAAAPMNAGNIDGVAFEWMMDADSRLGPVLEAIVNGHYYWIPFQRLRTVLIDPPEDLRDLVWMPAHFTFTNGGETVGLIPTRYPSTETHSDPLLRLARKTEWTEITSEIYLGQGQRMLTTDNGDYSLMDVRRIEFNPPFDTDSNCG